MRTLVITIFIAVVLLAVMIGYMHFDGSAGSGPGSLPGSATGTGPSSGDGNLTSAVIINPLLQKGDPYMTGSERVIEPPADHTVKTAVCGVRFVDYLRKRYEIKTFRDESAASRDGYVVTHRGYCGTCSTLQDLAVYLQRRDLTYAVRSCSFRIARGPVLSCLEKIGFSPQCALTWYYNIRNTGRNCMGTCLLSWLRREPLNKTDGSLNDCLQCDEDKSGPVFKYYAGRTRRNSGIRSEIDRYPGELSPVTHDYR